MNMTIMLDDLDQNNKEHQKKLELAPFDKECTKVRIGCFDNEYQGRSVVVKIDDLRKALTAIKSLK